jgi:HEAT repeat protein/predicted Ser/Thr protein kinase
MKGAICPGCRAENEAGAGFCRVCGKLLPAAEAGSLVAGRYEIVGVLGEGGMGTVYKAHDRVLDELVALKMLRPSFGRSADVAKRFRSEIKLARKVSHRNVCRIHEYGEDGGARYISMEFIDGANLKEAVRGKGGLPLEEARELGIQIAKGLQAIHDVGIIHRDLKTANIMRDSRGIVRLMDFGIAKKWGDESREGVTTAGDIVGTPEYMSPEQARGQKLDFRSDIYSLGIVFFEILTGALPFKGESPVDTLLMQVQTPPPVESVPEAVRPVVLKALAKNPGERYATARGFVADLRLTVPTAQPRAVSLADLDKVASAVANPDAATGEATSISGILAAVRVPDEDSDAPFDDAGMDLLQDLGEPTPSPEVLARVSALAGQLQDPEPAVRGRAAQELGAIGSAAKEAVPALLRALEDGDLAVADAAAEAVHKITGRTPTRRRTAPPAPVPAVIPLMDSLRSTDSFARWRAALALGEIGAEAAAATTLLVETLDDADDNVRWAAATALGKIGPAARAAVPALTAALGDREDEVIHKHAAAALGRLGAAARDAVPGLIGALRDPDTTVRDEVVDALVKIGPAAVPALMEALKDDDERVRFEAADTLMKIGTALQPARPNS